MRKYILALLLLAFISAFAGNDKKYERTMARANAFYEHFAYQKAINLYSNALDIKNNQEPKLQIANCHRLMNNPGDAMIWYEKALADGPLSDADMLNYAQILSTLERYDSAHAILEKYQHQENWIEIRAEGFENVEKFYLNGLAYDINEFGFNSEEADFSPTFKNDSIIVFVTGRPFRGMFKPEYKADETLFLNLFEIGENGPEQLQRGINTRFHEGPTIFYANSQKMLFTRNNYNNSSAAVSEFGINHLKLYEASIKPNGRWEKPIDFPYNSDEYSVGHPALTPDEQTLYFASDMPGGYGGVDIYKCQRTNSGWSQPENLGPIVNTPRDEMFPYVSVNDFLYFASDGHEGIGGLDIFRLDMLNPSGKPHNMGFALNTNKDDFGIVLDNILGNEGYFSSNREGGTGGDDIYAVYIYDHVVTVNLKDADTRELIVGSVKVMDVNLSEEIRNVSGINSIQFPSLTGDTFMAHGNVEGYIPDSLRIEHREDTKEVRPLTYDIFLDKIEGGNAIIYIVDINSSTQQLFFNKGNELQVSQVSLQDLKTNFEKDHIKIDSIVNLKNVLYDFDKYNIREDASKALDEWVVFLNQYPDEKISLSSHTDVRGTNKYNERLAKRRVKAAVKYLIKAGISKDRFVEKSYGEEKLWETCEEEDCDENQHQNNRRTEILIERSN